MQEFQISILDDRDVPNISSNVAHKLHCNWTTQWDHQSPGNLIRDSCGRGPQGLNYC